jgi:hypothetical protein
MDVRLSNGWIDDDDDDDGIRHLKYVHNHKVALAFCPE